MNTLRLPVISFLLSSAMVLRSVAGAPPATAPAAAGTNAVKTLAPPPVALFDMSSGTVKDPFFPLSTRLAAQPTNAPAPAFSIKSFHLKGISGPVSQRLAIINNRTLAAGEEADVSTDSGDKVRIHCVQIKEASVVIRIQNQPEALELHFEDRSLY